MARDKNSPSLRPSGPSFKWWAPKAGGAAPRVDPDVTPGLFRVGCGDLAATDPGRLPPDLGVRGARHGTAGPLA